MPMDWAEDRAWRLLAPTNDKERVARLAQAFRHEVGAEREACLQIVAAYINEMQGVPDTTVNRAHVRVLCEIRAKMAERQDQSR